MNITIYTIVKNPSRHYKPISEYATVFYSFLFAQKPSRNHKGARSSSLVSLDLLDLPQYVEPGNIFVSFSPVFSVINQINSRNNVTGASMHRIWDTAIRSLPEETKGWRERRKNVLSLSKD